MLFYHPLVSTVIIPAACLGAKFNAIVWLRPATTAPCGCPSPHWGGEENGKKQAKNWWVGIRAV